MEWAKIKNIVILILCTVNLLLLALLLHRANTSRVQSSELLSDAVSILADNGVALPDTVVVPEGTLSALSMERDTALESTLAQALLGPCESEASGSTYTYVNSQGSAIFRSTGDFVITFSTQGSPLAQGELSAHAVDLMQGLGLTCRVESQTQSASQTQVTLCQLWEEVPVFSCQIVLTYDGQSLQSIQGRRMLARQGVPLPDSVLSPPTALVRFLSSIISNGEVCNTILQIQSGYQMSVSLTEPAALRPVWRLSTDTGDFDLDLTSGTAVRFS